MIYLLTFGASSIFVALYKKRDNVIWGMLAVLLLTLLAAYRGHNVGTDTSSYIRLMRLASNCNYVHYINYGIEHGLELGYMSMSFLASRFQHGERWLFFFCALITNTYMFRGIENVHRRNANMNVALMWMMYCLMFYNITLNNMRQFIGVAICFWVFSDVNKLSLRKLLIASLLAFLFHYSAVLILLPYCMFKVSRINKTRETDIGISLCLSLIVILIPYISRIMVTNISLLQRYRSFEKRMEIEWFGNMWTMFLRTVFIVIFFLSLKNEINENKKFLMYIAVVDLAFSIGFSMFMYRVECFFSVFECIYAVEGVQIFGVNKSSKRIAEVLICILCFIFWYVKVVVNNLNETFPYVFS